MTDTTAQHIAARDDDDLLKRLIAAAEQADIPNADSWVRQNTGRLVSVAIDGNTTLTAVHAYASTVYADALATMPPRPGLNPAAVTDAQLALAVQAAWTN